jgi:hypothetical protein
MVEWLNNNFTHLRYIPKDKIYSIIARFKDENFGNVIGYASKEREFYFRLEKDFEKFDFINSDEFYQTIDNNEINVKLKLFGTWIDYKFKENKLYLL